MGNVYFFVRRSDCASKTGPELRNTLGGKGDGWKRGELVGRGEKTLAQSAIFELQLNSIFFLSMALCSNIE